MPHAPATSPSFDQFAAESASLLTKPAARTLQEKLMFKFTGAFMRDLASTPEGRVQLLAQLANAEGGDGGELMLFEHLLQYVEDEELRKLIRLHHEDELRHEQLFLARANAQGVAVPTIPDATKLLLRIDERLGLFNRAVESDEDVLRVYLALLVIEERATAQFSMLRAAFAAAGDDETVQVLAEVEADERRHLKYCHAISKRYCASEEARQAELRKVREIEAQCFAENGRAAMAWTLGRGSLAGWRQGLWSFLNQVQQRREPHANTAYADMVAQGIA